VHGSRSRTGDDARGASSGGRGARWGGDEFAILLPDCCEDEARKIIARVTPTTPSLQSCAAGIAEWDGVETSDELVRRADVELLRHKHVSAYR